MANTTHNTELCTFLVPRDSQPSRCRGCGAVVYWITTPRGKKMPVDTQAEGGLTPLPDRDGRGVSHFATCPQAETFRRRRVARGRAGR